MTQNVIDILVQARDQASATMKRVQSSIQNTQKSIGGFFESNQAGMASI
jgi:hypothetical protein